ncbi:MAG: zf-TFIIB domain-containing protein [bacterium]|nr:zf-TFIIB domain-containing protein [bacterium]
MVNKPSTKEEEYFARQEFEKRKKAEEEKQNKLAADEKKHLKSLHYMRCPKCGMQLVEIDFQGIKIDKCTNCSGSWFDAGEVEDLLNQDKSVLTKIFLIIKK